jgi:hypothetical protein
MDYKISLTEAEDKALRTRIPDIEAWLYKIALRRARQAVVDISRAEISRRLEEDLPIHGSSSDIVLSVLSKD